MPRDYDIPSVGLLDTNFFVSCFVPTDRFHRDAREYLRALAAAVVQGRAQLWTAPRVIEETLWVGCRSYYEAEYGSGSFGALSDTEKLSALSRNAPLLRALTETLLSEHAPYSITSLVAEDMRVAADVATEYAVPVTDACLAALAPRLCDGNIVTNDRHMERIPEINCVPCVTPRP
ncbi:MAG: PIN domain-containing protein [Armatimonadia bacterium]|nr:PIN domain-containing protein [Armatimonadia bacterium]